MKAADAISLAGKVAIITGAGRGIGRAAAIAMAQAGAAIIVNDIDALEASKVVDSIRSAGGSAASCVAPIGTGDAAELCVETALEQFGRLDIMACNAGILKDRVLWNTDDADFDTVMTTHLRGTFTCARAAVRHFRTRPEGGRLILVSSIAGQRGNFGQTTYAAAKAGIAAFARTWSMELAKSNVTVNAVVPNALTAMTETMLALQPFAEMRQHGEPLPAKLRQDFGVGIPEDVAPLFVYLACDRSKDLTGQCIGIGGDRLSIWAHPVEADHRLKTGGWDAVGVADALEGPLGTARQSVGIDFI